MAKLDGRASASLVFLVFLDGETPASNLALTVRKRRRGGLIVLF